MAKEQTPWKEAIVKVLETEGKAMHYADIASEIQKQGLRSKVGATPAATVYTVIYEAIKKDGSNSQFVKVGTGEFLLRKSSAPTKSGRAAVPPLEEEEATETGGIIKAFGMFWRRDWVEWSAKPGLMGQQQEGSDPVNFSEQQGVYLLHDGREVIYVGRATEKRLGTRLLEHTRDRLNGRWDRFSWFGLLDVTDEGKLAKKALGTITEDEIIITLEALLIEGLEPRQNRKRGDAFRAVEYLQAQDPALAMRARKKVAEEMLSKFTI
jgi:hypothetical protein